MPTTPVHFYPAGSYGDRPIETTVPLVIDGATIARVTARIDERQRRRGVR